MFSLRILWRNRLFIAGVDAEICWSERIAWSMTDYRQLIPEPIEPIFR